MQNLLFLHGAIGSSKQFDALLPLLKEKFYVSTLNFSGHGGTSIPTGEFCIELFAQDVLNYLNGNNIQTIDIFGYSMGGYVGLYLAKHHPERVGKVFTLATKFNWTVESATKEVAMLNAEKIEAKVPAFAKALQQMHGAENWKIVLSKTAEMMVALGNQPTLGLNDFAGIEHSVLVSVGDKDTMVSLEETISVYRQLKNADLLVLPQTQHPFEKVNPEIIYLEVLRCFGE